PTDAQGSHGRGGRGVLRPLVWLWTRRDGAGSPLEGGLFGFRDGVVTPSAARSTALVISADR
ncbi:MAG: hypothetical protein ACHREM_26145, partial [Polyangiales bacterium]